ncbi:MAG: glycosyltransferase family 2 protein [Chloroflexi bacterium]|nr:glycosyltransferase family 2 protein [Chloroflexota bacterium]
MQRSVEGEAGGLPAPPVQAVPLLSTRYLAPARLGKLISVRKHLSGGHVPSISAVLPAYNEELIIERTVRATVEVLERLADDYEVIVVNDGSRDATPKLVGRLAVENPAVRCVSHERNQGYGAALATGFAAARKELVFLTDGDKQFDVRELALLLPHIPDADLVIGIRHPRRDPFMRRLNGWGWNWLVNALFGYTARDVDCAFKLFRRRVLDEVRVHARGATFSAEFLIKSRRLGFRIVELDVSHYPRTAGRATGARPDVIVRAFKELFWLWRHLDEELAADRALAHPASQPET